MKKDPDKLRTQSRSSAPGYAKRLRSTQIFGRAHFVLPKKRKSVRSLDAQSNK